MNSMIPADLARAAAISFECKKDALQQRQSGDWKISFTVQGIDMDERITRAAMGTRFVAVLVEIDDSELPIAPAEKETKGSTPSATPRPAGSPIMAGAKRDKQAWRDVMPSAQASMLCDKPPFHAFLREHYPNEWRESCAHPAECVRLICGVTSRSLLNEGAPRVIWHQLNNHFVAWERVGA